jgi:hypothetical protein
MMMMMMMMIVLIDMDLDSLLWLDVNATYLKVHYHDYKSPPVLPFVPHEHSPKPHSLCWMRFNITFIPKPAAEIA